jgi:hypothetical protein
MPRVFPTLLLATLLLPAGSRAQAPSREQQWQQDLTVLATEFPKRQIDPWGRVSQAQWQQEIAQLQALPIAILSNAEIAAHIGHLLARYHDGHLTVRTDDSTAEPLFLPLRFRWFPSGIFVTAAADPRLLGAKLLQLGNTPADALLQRIAPWISIENDSGLHTAAFTALSNTAILADAGIAPYGHPVAIKLQPASGNEIAVALEPHPYAQIAWPTPPRLPLYRQDHTPANWTLPMPAHNALYLRYAECNGEPGNRGLATAIATTLSQHPTTRIIIDLRRNSGGDSAAFSPVLAALRKQHVGDRHQLIALTDRNTFSSAFRNAVELKTIGARIVGEAPSQRPVYTGNVKSFLLPNSHLQIRYTTKWSILGPASTMELTPDIPIQPTPQQYLAGDDPVLDLALTTHL